MSLIEEMESKLLCRKYDKDTKRACLFSIKISKYIYSDLSEFEKEALSIAEKCISSTKNEDCGFFI